MLSDNEEYVQVHSDYQDNYQSFSDWFQLIRERYDMCVDTTGDRHTITNKLERSQVMQSYLVFVEREFRY